MYSVKPAVAELIALLKAHGVTHAVICAGSRSAPLAHSFANCPDLHCLPMTDERSAAFTALGISEALGKPTAICCTSGSALLDIAPAAAEAFYRHIPLIIISADRPAAWIGQMDGQTMIQPGALHHVVRREVFLPEPHDMESSWFCNRLINEALLCSREGEGGPVHINIPLSEPLFDMSLAQLPSVRTIRRDDVSRTFCTEAMLHEWQNSERPLIIPGQLQPNHGMTEILARLAESGCVIAAEHLSNTCEIRRHQNVIGLTETILAAPDCDPFSVRGLQAPDFVLTFGGHIVSKRLKLFLRGQTPFTHWHIDMDGGNAPDLFRSLTRAVRGNPRDILEDLLQTRRTHTDETFARGWSCRNDAAQHHLDREDDSVFSDIGIMRRFIRHLPEGCMLHLANSSPVRNAQFFTLPQDTHVSCNRGINGIDGSLSAAAGYATVSNRTVFSLIGDLSFFYDRNALWRETVPNNLRILLFNNGGGGIFHMLPGLNSEHRNRFIAGSNTMKAEKTAEEAHMTYLHAENYDALEQALAHFCSEKDEPMLLETTTDITASAEAAKKAVRLAALAGMTASGAE
ncbi:MAG: 2-succinyl-5-enolpyruvyl-6-hydroxy-3-cyclohexene-1-carboxylic-acid synthase [Desulfovibrionaceae bacterium]|nr:2-succinyl-5-enolpyruvyl-6-hydroxy-3-cyclohexene-1-carboxylic-acid synthase [Desulfovibrionaceae bacterium]